MGTKREADRPPPHRGRVVARVYRRLLADILHGRQPPGARVNLPTFADLYGASTNSIRETLIHLTGSGLVVRKAMHGFQIAPATQSDLLEVVKTLGWLEETGIRESIANDDRHWEERVLAAHRALSQAAPEPGLLDKDIWDEYVLSYHEALVSACHSSILIEQCRALQQRLLRYRNLAAAGDEHDEARRLILLTRDAILRRDADYAVELLRAYYKRTTDAILASGAVS
ncbi:MAG TPA: GntR family transcriptional regulator [Gammaproteobacteria bacterium]|nr:GntR family transcriptional regulator [Gammaproteobacteria bacterium]